MVDLTSTINEGKFEPFPKLKIKKELFELIHILAMVIQWAFLQDTRWCIYLLLFYDERQFSCHILQKEIICIGFT